MKFQSIGFVFSASVALAFLCGCTESTSNNESLTLNLSSNTIHVGGTMTTTGTEKTLNATGAIVTNANFTDYKLTSSDTSVVAISGISMIGKAAGTSAVTARDNEHSSLSSTYTITVVSP